MNVRKLGKSVFALLFIFILAFALVVSPAAAEQPERVKVLIGFDRQPGPAEEGMVRGAGGAIKYTYHLVPAIAASIPEAAIQGLLKNPNVTSVEPDISVYAIDAELDNTWGVKRIGAGTVHDGGNKGSGVKVAIIDTGVDYTHPDLDANFDPNLLGYDFVNDDTDPMDDYGHGTHVAGTVAAEDNDVGVVGVAPEVELYALKVLDANGDGYYSDVIAAIQWAVGNGIQVTNNSYGSSGYPGATVEAAFDNAEAAGVLHVAAAGNTGTPPGRGDNVIYPARWPSVIAVAATGEDDNRARWSSTGPDVELAAPGVSINSTLLGGGYGEKNGTSMASPHVAGTAALVITTGITDANGNGYINDEVRQKLVDTADDLGDTGWDPKYGYGLVDADEAAPPPAVPNNPPTANSGGPYTGTEDVPITFDSSDPDNDSLTYKWDFGDGTTATVTTASVTHTYTTGRVGVDKTYTVTLIVNDGKVDSDPATTTATVAGVNDLPVANADGPYYGVVNESITFDASGSKDEEGIHSYTWDFGDGNDGNIVTVTTSTTTHAYTGTGTYNVTLTVTDTDGATATDITTAEVTQPPTGDPNDMYVWSIDFSKKTAGPNTFLYFTVTISRDSNANGVAEEADAEVPLATVSLRLDNQTTGQSWTSQGDTGDSGKITFQLNKAPSGTYVAEVTGLTHATYVWHSTICDVPDEENPSDPYTL